MPIIKSNNNLGEGLVGAEFSEKFVKVSHVENVSPIFAANQKSREDSHNGFSDDRSMRKIASIPPLVAIEAEKTHPGLFQDKNMMKEFLRSDVGKLCMTVRKGV